MGEVGFCDGTQSLWRIRDLNGRIPESSRRNYDKKSKEAADKRGQQTGNNRRAIKEQAARMG
jgi:hypothetical protein